MGVGSQVRFDAPAAQAYLMFRAGLAADRQHDLAVFGELDRVPHQVDDDLPQSAPVADRRPRHLGANVTDQLQTPQNCSSGFSAYSPFCPRIAASSFPSSKASDPNIFQRMLPEALVSVSCWDLGSYRIVMKIS